jgi:branched-chain amino acid transport system permease protein
MIEALPGVLINGCLVGGVLALIALALNIQYGVGRVFNIAHGEFIMLGAFITYTVYVGYGAIAGGVDPLISLAVSGPLLFIIGFVLYRTLFTSLRTRAPTQAAFEGNSLLAAFGLIFIIQNVAILIWTGRTRAYIWEHEFAVPFAGTVFRFSQIIAFALAIVIGVAFYIFVNRTRLGKAIRAAAQDPATAGLMGININLVLALCFGFGALLAGIAGSLISMYSSISEVMGLGYAIGAIIVMVLGGLGSIPGSFIGGFIIGIIGSIVTHYEPALVVPAYYALFLILLLVRPQGLLGK